MTTTKAMYLGKSGNYDFKFQLDNPAKTELVLKVSKANEKFSILLDNISIPMLSRSDYWFMIGASSGWINTLESLQEEKKETTLAASIPKEKESVNLEFIPADTIETDFIKLNAMSCKTEQKGKYTYIPWSSAWKKIKEFDPNANFEVHTTEQGFPAFIKPKMGGFVKVSVTINNQTHTEFHAIMNNYNNAIIEPDSTDINNSIKRCLVKVLAYFGFGLSLYEGEELPEDK
jgi:hypothetical protein